MNTDNPRKPLHNSVILPYRMTAPVRFAAKEVEELP